MEYSRIYLLILITNAEYTGSIFQTNDGNKQQLMQCTMWDEWSNCKGECGEVGIATRHCSHTFNENVTYGGFDYEWKTCNLNMCTLSNYSELVKGNVFRLQELNYLEYAVGNSGHRTVLDNCITGYCEYALVEETLKNNTDLFWNALQCVKHNLGCPVKGGWSSWSLWSKCTASCGPGIQYRLRYCNNPTNSRASLNCTGSFVEYKNCFGNKCQNKTDGLWCKWTEWSQCNVRRGNGIVIRKRFCQPASTNNGSSCFGPHTEIDKCYQPDVNGGWSEWQRWSHCSVECGKGTRYRTRSCTRPEPNGDGIDCIGNPIEIANCHLRPCKGPSLMVTTFNKEAVLKYSSTGPETTLLHVFVRFYPLDGSGTIIRRFHDNCDECDNIELNIVDYKLALNAVLNGCNTTLSTTSRINVGWNEVYFMITKSQITLHANTIKISSNLKCNSTLVKLNQVMNVGEGFEGYIEKLYVNFVPYAITINNEFTDNMFLPYVTWNTVFEPLEEISYADLSQTIKIPCPRVLNAWKLELYLRFQPMVYGDLISMNSTTTDFICVSVVNNFFKLKVCLEDYFYETLIKYEEIDSSWIHLELEQKMNVWHFNINGEKQTIETPDDIQNEICHTYFYTGNRGLRGILGYLKVDKEILNINNFIVDSASEYNIISYDLSDFQYNEIKTNTEDIIKLNCIVNYQLEHENVDITWISVKNLDIQKISPCESNYVVTTSSYTSQLIIVPNGTLQDDQFYMCTSSSLRKIICVYGIVNFFKQNNNIPLDLKTFILLSRIIAIVTMFIFIIIVVKIIK